MSSLSKKLRQRIRKQGQNRCGYCQSHQQYILGKLEIDHIIPVAAGGSDDEENLWLDVLGYGPVGIHLNYRI